MNFSNIDSLLLVATTVSTVSTMMPIVMRVKLAWQHANEKQVNNNGNSDNGNMTDRPTAIERHCPDCICHSRVSYKEPNLNRTMKRGRSSSSK